MEQVLEEIRERVTRIEERIHAIGEHIAVINHDLRDHNHRIRNIEMWVHTLREIRAESWKRLTITITSLSAVIASAVGALVVYFA